MAALIFGVAGSAARLKRAVFSPFTGTRCRQADEGRATLISSSDNVLAAPELHAKPIDSSIVG